MKPTIILICSLLVCLLGLSLPGRASHIVGGEFELLHLEGHTYRLSLILYSDDINIVDPAAIDPYAVVHIWSKGTDQRIRSIHLPKTSHTSVPYTNPDCAIPQLSTSKVIYSSEIILEPDVFNEEEGYYIDYERCCRNGVINNIKFPGETGQAFYMEFPAVVKEGEPFINSSPYLFPPLSDFARLGYPFYFDFKGTDPDGDSLTYALVTPLAGSSSPDPYFVVPPPQPAPYQEVEWATSYGLHNTVPGTPSLHIDQKGVIKVTPVVTGLFVFSVLVEEFRDGEKIGEIRRDFQMLVYDYQGSDLSPELQARKPANGQFYRDEIKLTDADFTDYENNRCLILQVRDQDIKEPNAPLNGHEPLTFKVQGVNFNEASTSEYLSVSKGSVNKDNQVFSLELCLPLCPPLEDRPYIFNVIAYDDACAVPLTDTLRVVVDISQGVRNKDPETNTSVGSPNQEVQNLFRTLGEPIEFQVTGRDYDEDNIHLYAVGDGFSLEEYGMLFTPKSGKGNLQSSFSWNTSCENVSLADKNLFTVFFITEDEDFCLSSNSDTVAVNIGLVPPQNNKPAIEIVAQEVNTFEAKPDSNLIFEIRGFDRDSQDTLLLQLDSVTYASPTSSLLDTISLHYEWQDVKARGEAKSTLRLFPDCSIFQIGEQEKAFTFHFSVQDDPCYVGKSDTLSLQLTLKEEELSFDEVRFPNVFTPNQDNKNDFFEILNLPGDACYNYLEKIVIFNRWGRILFETTDRNFKWDGGDFPTGSYFYQVEYSKMVHRSNLSLIRGDTAPQTSP